MESSKYLPHNYKLSEKVQAFAGGNIFINETFVDVLKEFFRFMFQYKRIEHMLL